MYLNSNEIFISDLVTNLTFCSSASSSPFIHSLLQINPHQAEVLCNQFEIFNSKLNTIAVSIAIDSWAMVQFNIREFMEDLQMKAENKSELPIQKINNQSTKLEIRPATMAINLDPRSSSYQTYINEAPISYNPHPFDLQTSYSNFMTYDNTGLSKIQANSSRSPPKICGVISRALH